MMVIGLTGSIGMGKSFVANCFRENGIGVFDADAEIHKLMEPGGEAVKDVLSAFPEAADEAGGIDRKQLGQMVFHDEAKLRQLESILHPILKIKGNAFFKAEQEKGSDMIVQDIPLLFETGADKDCHMVIVVSAPEELQEKRVLKRENMDEATYEAIKKLQLMDQEKCKRADIVIQTSQSKEATREQVKEIIASIKPTQ